jgi:2-oxo-4-hydroxy-4-carboxy-5-ureidoimidazoline decarboxylase
MMHRRRRLVQTACCANAHNAIAPLLFRHRLGGAVALCLQGFSGTRAGNMTIDDLNLASTADFTTAIGAIYEHSPWIAARAAMHRPFRCGAALQDAMRHAVTQASEAEQLALVRAHPDLAGRLARAGELAPASASEQAGLGLDRLSEDEFAKFDALNSAYTTRFGFPFVIAVKRHTRASVLEAFTRRLQNDAATELQTALEEIHAIAGFRLHALGLAA